MKCDVIKTSIFLYSTIIYFHYTLVAMGRVRTSVFEDTQNSFLFRAVPSVFHNEPLKYADVYSSVASRLLACA